MRGPGETTLQQREGARWTPDCLLEAEADRYGSVALAPLLWQGDLPGIEAGRPMFVRDLGPERNRAVRERFPDRPALVFGYAEGANAPELQDYDDAIASLWGRLPVP